MQIQKINIRCERSLEIRGLKATCVNKTGQILIRTEVGHRYYIRVMNRLSGEVSSEFPSKCDHFFASLIAHPTDAGFVLESCWVCEVIRNYNIHIGQCSALYKGYRLHVICHDPARSILGFKLEFYPPESPHLRISIIKWNKEHPELQNDKKMYLAAELIQMCYNELCEMLVGTHEGNEINAVKLESEADTLKLSDPIWKLSGMVDGRVIKPTALTSDKRGNIFVGDGANQRIMKINCFTGDAMSILLLEKGNKQRIRSLFWSDTEPNLIVIRRNKICS